jgi:YaiO family outer membrane protein
VTARTVRDRLEGAARHWWATTQYSVDLFDDGTDPWQEFAVYLTRRTPVGSLILRGSHATRFAQDDQLIEAEFYPSFRPGTYAYLGAGVSTSRGERENRPVLWQTTLTAGVSVPF